MKKLKFMICIFLVISCKEKIDNKKYRNSHYTFYTTNGKTGEWRKITDNSDNSYKPESDIYYFFDNGERFAKIKIIDNYSNRQEYFYNKDTLIEKIIYKKDTVFKEIRKDGFHVQYLNNKGQLLAKGYFRNNKKEGPWEHYFESGAVKRITNYKNGLKDGKILEYYENGKIHIIGAYWKDNKIDTFKKYYKNGSLHHREVYSVDTIKRECFGYAEKFYVSGDLHKHIPIVDWKREGIAKIYYKNGALEFLTTYKANKINGIIKGYYENGNIFYSGIAKDSLEDTLIKYYDEEGRLTKTEKFKNGVLQMEY